VRTRQTADTSSVAESERDRLYREVLALIDELEELEDRMSGTTGATSQTAADLAGITRMLEDSLTELRSINRSLLRRSA
jgi:hypothetical protein